MKTGYRGAEAARRLIKGLAAAVGVTLAGMAILSALVVYAGLEGGALTALNQALRLAAVFAGTLIAVGPGGEHGMATGAALGLLYIALGLGACALWGGEALTGRTLSAELAMGMILGGLSGALIANMPAGGGRRRRASRA